MIKKGFTLAELLITMSIIGVIAALTLPALNSSVQTSELQAQFKRTFVDLNDFSKYFMVEKGISVPRYVSTYGYQKFGPELTKYMANTTKTGNWTWSSGQGGAAIEYKYHAMTDPLGEASLGSICDASGFYTDGLGRIIAYDDAPKKGYNGPRICVDINGLKSPNTYGLDVFSFLFTVDGEVIPEGAKHAANNVTATDYDYGTQTGYAWQAGTINGPEYCTGSKYGQTCAYYAQRDVSPLDSSKSYWADFIGKKQYLNKTN